MNNELFTVCNYYFSVLIPTYLEIERMSEKEKRRLFRRVDYSEHIKAFNNLVDIVKEAESGLPNVDKIEDMVLLKSIKLNFLSLYKLLHQHILVAQLLLRKSNNETISMNNYLPEAKKCEEYRAEHERNIENLNQLFQLGLFSSQS